VLGDQRSDVLGEADGERGGLVGDDLVRVGGADIRLADGGPSPIRVSGKSWNSPKVAARSGFAPSWTAMT
jgi:hypothetical protein